MSAILSNVKINQIKVSNFRNMEFLDVSFSTNSTWIHGMNAQGKTNLLEAASLLTAMRSFRTTKISSLVRHKMPIAELLFEIYHENEGGVTVMFQISGDTKKVFINGEEYKKLSDYIGKFPTLSLCADDIKLLRGQPIDKRKFVDILISSLDLEYFEALKKYHNLLKHRNSLLKSELSDISIFRAFEYELAENAVKIWKQRIFFLDKIGKITCEKYFLLSGEKEKVDIKIKIDEKIDSVPEYLKKLDAERDSDRERGSTRMGPQRDDFALYINDKNAKEFASEGQQRSLALSLKLAEFELIKTEKKITPVLLCDDILSELDEFRRKIFWSCIDSEAQVIATSTSKSPKSETGRLWQSFEILNGKI